MAKAVCLGKCMEGASSALTPYILAGRMPEGGAKLPKSHREYPHKSDKGYIYSNRFGLRTSESCSPQGGPDLRVSQQGTCMGSAPPTRRLK